MCGGGTGHSGIVRDQRSGAKLRGISVEGDMRILWADQGKIITMDMDLSNHASVTAIDMGLGGLYGS